MRVTILSGFLGSGKTTLLRRLLREAKGMRIGVLVNDMAELEVDGDLIRATKSVSESDNTLVSLAAGSISGVRRLAFAEALDRWAEQALDHLIIETSGSTHPWALIGEILSRPAYTLGTFATLVDARAFVEDYGYGQLLLEQLIENEEADRRTTANLMADQIQCASLILLTKTDRVNADHVPFIRRCLEILNPHAEFEIVTRGRLPLSRLWEGPVLDAVHAHSLMGADSTWDVEELGALSNYDISSTVISDPRPLHPQRLWTLFRTRLGMGVHRSKGFIWMASRDEQVLLWNQAAGGIDLELLAYWKAAVVKDPLSTLLPEEKDALKQQLEAAHPRFGDRLNELTIIGTLVDRRRFVLELQDCFCTEEEIRHWEQGGRFSDPWPLQLLQVE